MSKSVAIIVTNHADLGTTGKKTGWYLPEVAHPYHVFKNAGYNVTFVSPLGGLAPLDPSSVESFKEDALSQSFLKDETAQEQLKHTKAVGEVSYEQFDAVFFAGGHGPMFDLPESEPTAALAAAVYDRGGVVSAVCHGPAGLVNIKLVNGEYLVKGKEVTCFTNQEEEMVKLCEAMPFLLETRLKERGAIINAAEPWHSCVRVAERLVTGQNPASASATAEQVVSLLA